MKINNNYNAALRLILCGGALIFVQTSCRQVIDIAPPTNTIVTEQAFSNDFNANGSILGLYSLLAKKQDATSFGNGWITYYLGAASDELIPFTLDAEQSAFFTNTLTEKNSALALAFNQAYAIIYQANASLEQLVSSKGISDAAKNRFKGEALFVRAFCYYQLTGIWGDVPFITQTDWTNNIAVAKSSRSTILEKIAIDLQDAISLLPEDYSKYQNERVRATKWSAIALLAKVFAELKNWQSVETLTTEVIASPLFSLCTDLNEVFLKNSKEAILQLYNQSTISPFNIVSEAYNLLPLDRFSQPVYYLSSKLLSSFEYSDKRRVSWIDSTIFDNVTYYYSVKYKDGAAILDPAAQSREYYMILRLAEMFLLRAEARNKLGNAQLALNDVNTVRSRSGLKELAANSNSDVQGFILEESRREFFIEWGKRWYDLRRSGAIDSVMSIASAEKGGSWIPYKKYFPFGLQELITNPKLIQTEGY